ncbi:unnamed protein product [Phytophthora lilii]|uniref:Unnamed protein product n=1 Tax=Phytophthora lilii TaxID=2077276 RepID=A0A9W6TBL1_9STRA|nr:unnamed protein product [Phytophthora lilii]
MADATQLSDQFLYQCAVKPDTPVKISKSKTVVEVPDNNQGSYSSGLITLDAASQLNGSKRFGSIKDGYIILPYVITMKNAGANDMAAAAHRFCLGLKCGVWNVVDALEVELNGQQLINFEDYKLYWNNIRAQTEWTAAEVSKHGADAYLYPDDWSSMAYSGSATTAGDGFVNNGTYTADVLGATATGSSLLLNKGYTNRLLATPPPVATTTTTLGDTGAKTFGWPTLQSGVSQAIAQQHGRGAFVAGLATAGNIMGTGYYMLKIRLTDLHPIFKDLDLVANPQLKLRLRVNTGYTDITVASGHVMSLSSTVMNAGKTVPFIVSSATTNNAMNAVLHATNPTTLRVAFGPLMNSLTTLATAGNYFPFTTSHLLIPFYDLANPTEIVRKPVKTCRYMDCYAQYFSGRAGTGVSSSQQNASFNFQLSGTWKNVKYVALIPFSETSSGHFATATAQQFESPFDSAPWTCQAGSSIRGFQVQIGNTNVFPKAIDYDYEQFLDEFAKINAINGDHSRELTNGLIDLQKWSTVNRVLIADCSRLTDPDVPQSVNVAGVNGSCQGTNVLILVVFEKSFDIDRLTGEVSKD